MKITFTFEATIGTVTNRLYGDVESPDGVGIIIACGDNMDQLFVEPMIHTCGHMDDDIIQTVN